VIFTATKVRVKNRGIPPDEFLTELVQWGKHADNSIFAPNPNPADIYASVKSILGPWTPLTDLSYRRAAMLEVMRVLAGFESSWNWNEGRDITNPTSVTHETTEAGAWQVSMNAIDFGQDLKDLTKNIIGSDSYDDGDKFQAEMKSNHIFAMEFIARLLRHTCKHNGPVLRHEIDPWLSRASTSEFQHLLGL
jgi:hypothetical protein